MRIITRTAQETINLGKRISRLVKKGDILCLFGQLGSGKTTFVKGLAEGLGIKKINVSSPSFILMRKYLGHIPLYHFDLYRIRNSVELCDIGYEEFVFTDGVAVIEWADKMGDLLPAGHLKINFIFADNHTRKINLSSRSGRYRGALKKI